MARRSEEAVANGQDAKASWIAAMTEAGRPIPPPICTLSLSFNNEGPLGAFFRSLGDTATSGAASGMRVVARGGPN